MKRIDFIKARLIKKTAREEANNQKAENQLQNRKPLSIINSLIPFSNESCEDFLQEVRNML